MSPGLLFLATAAGICLREPILIRSPRFWAEEASVYFEHARNFGVAALTKSHLGYYSLFSNLAGFLAASTSRVEYAPLVTTLLALLVQLIPAALILAGRISFLATPGQQFLALIAILVAAPSDEVWLNTVNSQFHLALACALLLFESEGELSLPGRWARRLLLLLAGLSGPVSCFLLPLFLWRAWGTRRREDIIQASLLSLCLAAHFTLWGAAILQGDGAPTGTRRMPPAIDVLPTALVTRTLFEPILGTPLANRLATVVMRSRSLPWRAHLLAGGFTALLLAWTWAMQHRQELRVRLLALTGPLLALLCMTGAIGSGDKVEFIPPSGGSGRYFYVPAVLSLLLLVAAWGTKKTSEFARWRGALALPLLLLAVGSHVLGILQHRGQYDQWPRWSDEVAIWREEPAYRPRIWPPDWTVSLSPSP